MQLIGRTLYDRGENPAPHPFGNTGRVFGVALRSGFLILDRLWLATSAPSLNFTASLQTCPIRSSREDRTCSTIRF